MSPEHHNAGWKLNGLDTSWLVCLPTIANWYNSIIACLYNHHAMCMLLFSIFFSSSRRLKRARSSQKIVIQHHQKRKPAAWRGVRRAASGEACGVRERQRLILCMTMQSTLTALHLHPSHTYIHTVCAHPTYMLHTFYTARIYTRTANRK